MASHAPSMAGAVRLRPPRAHVVRDPAPGEVGAKVDWSRWCLPEEDELGEAGEHQQIIWTFLSALKVLARERGWERVHIGANQFFAWMQAEPMVRVSPDVYLLDDPPPPPLPRMWQTWLAGHWPPRFALEVVSGAVDRVEGWQKDYQEAPAKYAQLGAHELAIFDPEAVCGRARRGRVALQVYRRDPDGSFVRVVSGSGPARSEEIDGWLVAVRDGYVARLRIARDADGRDRVPTLEELADSERMARGQERRAREQERRARGQERRAREAAEREAAELRAELDRLRGRS